MNEELPLLIARLQQREFLDEGFGIFEVEILDFEVELRGADSCMIDPSGEEVFAKLAAGLSKRMRCCSCLTDSDSRFEAK